ncbi:MAG: glycosyl hydrolase family 28 protein [Collinsella sp.]|nr:glycosyl hydrolase family 28 protein [Collinsella sp.]
MTSTRTCSTAARGIDGTGRIHVTEELQQLICDAAQSGVPAVITEGVYLTAPLFVPSNAHIMLERGAVIRGTVDEDRIPVIPTRAAGIECEWYPGVLNVNDAHDVLIEGPGAIDGQGPHWWEKYWGVDGHGGMRACYDGRGVRWACDYDCMRPRNVVVMESHDVTLRDFTSLRSGFWNIHICYSDHVHVDAVRILGGEGPSTDGIDIDSSHDVLVERCVTECNDDSICIKSGRDADGIRVGRPCHHITVRDCQINAGFGVTIGSEVSSGVHDIVVEDIAFAGTDCGFRIKSSEPRKGYIRDVTVENLRMTDVLYPIHICLNWNPGYSLCTLPDDYEGAVSPLWEKLLDRSELGRPDTEVSNVSIRHVRQVSTADALRPSRAFNIEGFASQPIRGLTLEDLDLDCSDFGIIEHVEGMRFNRVSVSARGSRDASLDGYDNR